MKRLYWLLLALLSVMLVFGPAVAEETECTEHVIYPGIYDYWDCDETMHWTTCEVCGEVQEHYEHWVSCGGNYDQCQVCKRTASGDGIVINVYHNWETKCDENQHWEECASCGEQRDHGEHRKWCMDEDQCIHCRKTASDDGIIFNSEEIEHNIPWRQLDKWGINETHHWTNCQDCGVEFVNGTGEHNTNCAEGDICQNCGYSVSENGLVLAWIDHVDVNWDERKWDENVHYFECRHCGGRMEEGEHIGTCADPTTCRDCGATEIISAWTDHAWVWSAEETHHTLSCVCGEVADYGEHSPSCANPDECNFCHFTVSGDGIVFNDNVIHNGVEWGNRERWYVSETHHWTTCADCGQTVYNDTHGSPCDNGDCCLQCGYTVSGDGIVLAWIDHVDVNWDEKSWDENLHWNECRNCGGRVGEGGHFGNCGGACWHCGAEGVNFEWFEHVGTLKFNADMHWEECSVCGEQWNHGEHQHSCVNEDQCAYCGFTASGDGIIFRYDHVDHQVEWGNPDKWSYDETYHWADCTACGEPVYHDEHVYACDDPDRCHQCGHYASEHGIVMGRVDHVDVNWDEFKWDENAHYFECRHCGGRQDENGHWGVCGSGVCNDCGAEGVNLTHLEHQMAWYTDGETHWEACACGEQQWSHGEHERSCANEDQCRHCGLTVSEHGVVFVNENIAHNFAWRNPEYWRADETRHWAICTDCGEEVGMGEHIIHCTGLDGTGVYDICQDCGYSVSDGITIVNTGHNCDWGNWQHDENSHYLICFDCGGRVDEDGHWGSCGTGHCNFCGADEVNLTYLDHDWSFESWTGNENMHWQQCVCGETQSYGEHFKWCMNEDECITCHMTVSAGNIVFAGEEVEHAVDWGNPEYWSFDEFSHWAACWDCGETVYAGEHHVNCDGDWGRCQNCGHHVDEGIQVHVYHGEINWDEWESDEYSCWHPCDRCDGGENHQPHTNTCENADVCIYCGAENVNFGWTEHVWRWTGEGDMHWQECVCGEQTSHGEHQHSCVNEDQCAHCGLTASGDGIIFRYDHVDHQVEWGNPDRWSYDETYHWADCTACGEPVYHEEHVYACDDPDRCHQCGHYASEHGIVMGRVDHVDVNWDELKWDENVHYFECRYCGGHQDENVHWNNCDSDVCNDCGAEGVNFEWTEHIVSWKAEGECHWEACACGEQQWNHGEHEKNCVNDDQCRHCGFTVSEDGIVFTNENIGHNFDWRNKDAWRVDETRHWAICTDCGEEVEMGEHIVHCTGLDGTGVYDVCQDCGYSVSDGITIVHTGHNPEWEAWEWDENVHYYTCKDCGGRVDEFCHYGTCLDDNVCVVCGAENVNLEWADHENEPHWDAESHWHECIYCGETMYHGLHQMMCTDNNQCRYCPATVSEDGITFDSEIGHSIDWMNPEAWVTDQYTHYTTCLDCGEAVAHATHNVDCNGVDGNGDLDQCQNCGLRANEDGIVIELNHDPNWDKMLWTDTQHWWVCNRCDAHLEESPHIGSCQDSAVCIVCGAEGISSEHNEHTWSDWQFDSENHWLECTLCGRKETSVHMRNCTNTDQCRHCLATESEDGITFWYGLAHVINEENPAKISADTNYHYWHCEECGERAAAGNHNVDCDGDLDRCTFCGLSASEDGIVIEINHDIYWDERLCDKDVHWWPCMREGCDYRHEASEHVGTCQDDTRCFYCQTSADDINIAYSDHMWTDWIADESTHRVECGLCGEVREEFEHQKWCLDENECGFCHARVDSDGIIMSDTVTHNIPWNDQSAWRADEEYHWTYCLDCGEEVEKYWHGFMCNEEPFVCSTCGRSREEDGILIGVGHDVNYDELAWNEEWHYYKCRHCDAYFDEESHIGSCQDDTICIICGAENVTTEGTDHVWNEWQFDGDYHWAECTLCGEKLIGEHEVQCDGDWDQCEVCGARCSTDGIGLWVRHDVNYDEYVANAYNHGFPCKREGCNEREEIEVHTVSCTDDTVCTICGYENPNIDWQTRIDHEYGEMQHDDTKHWRECAKCGGKEEGHHISNCLNPDLCFECGAEDVTIGEFLNHTMSENWNTDENTHFALCIWCGGYCVDPEPHLAYCGGSMDKCEACGLSASKDGINIQPYHDINEDEFHHDENSHWYECRGCDYRDVVEDHVGACNDATICTVCGAEDVNTTLRVHIFGQVNDFDENGHFQPCIYCGEKFNYYPHEPLCGNPDVCGVCGASVTEDGIVISTDSVVHTWGEYEFDAEKHWTYCTNCGVQGDTHEHFNYCYMGADYCIACLRTTYEDGINLTIEHEINYDEPQFDENVHWYECLNCGHREGEDVHVGTCQDDTICKNCGAEGVTTGWSDHVMDGNVYSDSDSHWWVCKLCGVESAHFTHLIQCDTNTCRQCGQTNVNGYVEHVDDAKEWQFNETHCWYICHGCGIQAEYGNHLLDCQTEACIGCGQTGVTGSYTHQYDFTSYKFDETSHWVDCLLCGEEREHELHGAACNGEADVCGYCGQSDVTISGIVHTSIIYGLRYDTVNHWYACYYCAEPTNVEAHVLNEEGNCACGFSSKLCIVSHPASVTVPAGTKARTTVVAEGEGLKYQWYVRDVGGAFVKSSTTSATYVVEMTEARNGREVYCVVTDQYGNSVVTNTATLTMGGTAAAITQQPASVTVAAGEKAVVSFQAEGDGLTYTWYYKEANGSKFNKTSAFTTNVYSVEMTTARNGRQLYCVVTDRYGNSVTTDTVTISMEAPKTELKITSQPGSVTVAEGEKATVTFTAQGDGLTYAWYYKEANGSKFYKTSAFTSNVYTVEMTAARDGRQLYCVVSDQYGNSVTTETVTISMEIPKTELKITSQPGSVTVAEGEKATVTFTAEGDGLTYAWYFKDATASKFSLTKSFTGTTYSVEMTAARDGRQLYCVVTDQYGNSVTTNTVSINMEIPKTELKIISQPGSVTVAEGEKATVTFTAEGDGLTYAWYFKDATASKFSLTKAFTGTTYSVEMTAARNGRQLYCVVTDQYGNSVTTATVTINMEEPKTELKITSQPGNVTVAEGEKAIVTFSAQGDGLTYAWYFKDATASKFSLTKSFTGTTYAVEMTAARSGRQLYCVVTDQYGNSVTTATVTISMEEPKTELKITSQPGSVTVAEGATATVSFAVQGDGLTYAWYFKDATASSFSLTKSFTGNTYSVAMTAARSGRQLYCVVTDAYGNTVRTNNVTISMEEPEPALKITRQPSSVTVAEGEKAAVSFAAEGEGLTYEWYFKNAGASSFTKTSSFTGTSYVVTMDSTRDGRQVYCKVTDANGNSVNTDVATLTMAK